MEKILIAIPARGGSKRLPKKNLFNIKGKPLIAYTIEAALNANLTDDIFVCTEDNEIAETSKKFGAKVFIIPNEMAGDLVSSTVPCITLLEHLSRLGKKNEYLFNLQPTSPLRNSDDIIQSFKALKDNSADFLLSVTKIDPHYFHWALEYKKSIWDMYFEKNFLIERPLLPNVYRPNGAIKLAKAEKILEKKIFFEKKLTVYEMPEEKSIHVSTLFDIHCIEGILNAKQN